MADKLPLSAPISFGSIDKEDHHHYVTFRRSQEGEGLLIGPRSVLRKRIEKGDLPWSDLRFD